MDNPKSDPKKDSRSSSGGSVMAYIKKFEAQEEGVLKDSASSSSGYDSD